jgi:hypothetical protein
MISTVKTEHVWIGSDNSIDLVLQDDSSGVMAASDLSLVTRITLSIGDLVVDSGSDVGTISWEADGAVALTLGGVEGLVAGNFICNMTIFGPQYPNGIVWSPFFVIKVIA